jgi:CubicO group peptidase (beta-lactamase class C family)
MSAPVTAGPRNAIAESIGTGLRPTQRVVGEDTRWTLAERMQHYCLPGVSIALLHGGAIEWAQGYGVIEAGGGRAVAPDTLFQAASMSKPLAAFLVMQQVQAGRLDLDRDVNDWLRSWRVPPNAFTAARP